MALPFQLLPSKESQQIEKLNTGTCESGTSVKSFRFDPQDKEDFLRSKTKRKFSCNSNENRKRKFSRKSNDIQVLTVCGERDPLQVLYVSFTRDVPEMKDTTEVDDDRRPLKSRRIQATAVIASCESPVDDIIDLLVSSGEET